MTIRVTAADDLRDRQTPRQMYGRSGQTPDLYISCTAYFAASVNDAGSVMLITEVRGSTHYLYFMLSVN